MSSYGDDVRGVYQISCLKCLRPWNREQARCPECGSIASFKEYCYEWEDAPAVELVPPGYLESLRQALLDRLVPGPAPDPYICEWCGLSQPNGPGLCPRCGQPFPAVRLVWGDRITVPFPRVYGDELPF